MKRNISDYDPEDFDNLIWCHPVLNWKKGVIINSDFIFDDKNGNVQEGLVGDWLVFDDNGDKTIIKKDIFNSSWETGTPSLETWNAFPQTWPTPGNYIVRLRDGSIRSADFYVSERGNIKDGRWTPCDKKDVIMWKVSARS